MLDRHWRPSPTDPVSLCARQRRKNPLPPLSLPTLPSALCSHAAAVPPPCPASFGVVLLRPPLKLVFPRVHQLPLDPQLPRQLVDVVAALHPLHYLLFELSAMPSPISH